MQLAQGLAHVLVKLLGGSLRDISVRDALGTVGCGHGLAWDKVEVVCVDGLVVLDGGVVHTTPAPMRHARIRGGV